jgi:hypothetical protein
LPQLLRSFQDEEVRDCRLDFLHPPPNKFEGATLSIDNLQAIVRMVGAGISIDYLLLTNYYWF